MSTLATLPYNYAVTATKSDTVNINPSLLPLGRTTCDAIYVGGAGVVAVVFENDAVLNFTCVAGQILPVRAKRINSTNTTATLTNFLFYF